MRISIASVVVKISLLLLLIILYFNVSSDTTITRYEYIKVEREGAYFEGQKDALSGDIRIVKIVHNGDTCWTWKTSPWDSGSQPMFDPLKK